MSDLKEKKINSKIVYSGDFLDVRKDDVILPNGKTSSREWINHPGAVVVIPILPNGDIAMIRQFRYSVGEEFIELPAGKLDKGETPEECAKRELEEEIGFKTNKLNFIATIHPAIGFANEKMSIFLAMDFKRTPTLEATSPLIPVSISSNIKTGIDLDWVEIDLIANAILESSPPELN